MDNKTIILNFLNQMAGQDNRATAAPYFYVIRTKVKRLVPDGYGDDTSFICDGDEYESRAAAKRELLEYGHQLEDVEKLLKRGQSVDFKWEWEHKGMFLTETDAEQHLKCNRHHYSHDAHTYIDHAWRAPELESFFKALFKEFNVEPKNWGR